MRGTRALARVNALAREHRERMLRLAQEVTQRIGKPERRQKPRVPQAARTCGMCPECRETWTHAIAVCPLLVLELEEYATAREKREEFYRRVAAELVEEVPEVLELGRIYGEGAPLDRMARAW